MTKRPFPFEPNICRQSKIHLNNYENDLKVLKSIEERNLKRLMDGSRKLHAIILNNEDYSNSENVIEDHHKKNNFMQKCVTDYFTVNGKKLNDNSRILNRTSEIPIKCSYCDSITSSVQQCVECSEFYCSTCSFVIYESFEDKRVCLSCS